MKRREFITLLGGAAAAWPLAARAQQPERMRLIGVLLGIANDAQGQARIAALRQALQHLGWIEGQNVQIVYRWTAGNPDQTRAYAAELVRLAPDVLFAAPQPPVVALQQETRSIPIVFAQLIDPVGFGLVSNLARPGGNVTGFPTMEFQISGKWLELLTEIAPRTQRVAVLHNPDEPAWPGFRRSIVEIAQRLGVPLVELAARNASEIETGIEAFASKPAAGMVPIPTAVNTVHRQLIIALAARHRIPAVYPYRFFVTDGGLISYGTDNIEVYRRAASYLDRILKGEKPADLPVQNPNKYELVISLKTARALGLDVPDTLLARADEVIE